MSNYHFGDIARWSWPWTSPTYLGAAVVAIAPVLWGSVLLFRRSLLRLFFVVLEAGLIVVLCKTYSRGALVALFAAGGVFASWLWMLRNRLEISFVDVALNLAARSVVVLAAIWTTGFASRIAPHYVVVDRSVINRAAIWIGGLRMIQASPFSGWGDGAGAINYTHWFQPLDHPVRYGELVSGNLSFAVEHGLPLFGITLALLMWAILLPVTCVRSGVSDWKNRSGRLTLVATCGSASLVGLLVANSSSAVLYATGINGLVVLFFVGTLAALNVASWRSSAKLATISVVLAALVSLGMWCASAYSARQLPLIVARLGPDCVLLSRRDRSSSRYRIRVAPDPLVLGADFGKALRRFVLAAPPDTEILVDTSSQSPEDASVELSLWLGRTVELVGKTKSSKQILIHPIFAELPRDIPRAVVVVLPSFDQIGQNAVWSDSPSIVFSKGGTDIRPVWPEIAISLVQQFRRD